MTTIYPKEKTAKTIATRATNKSGTPHEHVPAEGGWVVREVPPITAAAKGRQKCRADLADARITPLYIVGKVDGVEKWFTFKQVIDFTFDPDAKTARVIADRRFFSRRQMACEVVA